MPTIIPLTTKFTLECIITSRLMCCLCVSVLLLAPMGFTFMHYKTPHLSSNLHQCTLKGDVITWGTVMNLRLTHNMHYMFHLKSQITASMNPLLAAYIFTGVSLTVIMISVLYFFVTCLCKSSCAKEQDWQKQPLLHKSYDW